MEPERGPFHLERSNGPLVRFHVCLSGCSILDVASSEWVGFRTVQLLHPETEEDAGALVPGSRSGEFPAIRGPHMAYGI